MATEFEIRARKHMKKNGYVLTAGREAVLRLLAQAKRPFGTMEAYRALARENLVKDRGTVAAILKLYVKLGFAIETKDGFLPARSPLTLQIQEEGKVRTEPLPPEILDALTRHLKQAPTTVRIEVIL
jgi:Fe2+ or Zn2+ uptake regulation protein